MDPIRQAGAPRVGAPHPQPTGPTPAKAEPAPHAAAISDAWAGSPLDDGAFDVADASERIVQASNGDLEQAYFKAISMRNLPKQDPAYERRLGEFSRAAGFSAPLGADALRDMEHYLFAAAYTANGAPGAKSGSYGDRVGQTLKREVPFLSMVINSVGYTAAKAVNNVTKAFGFKFLNSRTQPSLQEMNAGIRGAWRGLKD